MGRRTFSKEYKLQTIKQVIEDGKSVNEVSKSLGITEQTIYRWLREYDKYGQEAFKGFGNVRVDNQYKIKILEKKNKKGERNLKKVPSLLKREDKRESSVYHQS